MAITNLTKGGVVSVITATATATSAPTGSTDGYVTPYQVDTVRTFVAYSGAVTAAVLRLWVRDQSTGTWYRGASSTDVGALAPTTDGEEARDWVIGQGVEFTFQLESITPSGGAPTVAVRVQGVQL